ncbi:MAG TPA: hypothetical protein P5117_00695 [Spirochaetia bacterium]|nr:hypothetical protein [Spirochaetales bacterium]HRY80473.1 hypothetical protein [Spirochaetia bacterium]HRZ87974.1 hypothetical protein [Spirochaetia bacterium]
MVERVRESVRGSGPVRNPRLPASASRSLPRGVLLALVLLAFADPGGAQVTGLSGIRFESPIPVPVYLLDRTIAIPEAVPGYSEPDYIFRAEGGNRTLRALDLYRYLGDSPVALDLTPGAYTFQLVLPGNEVRTIQVDTREPGDRTQTWEIRPGREGANVLGLTLSLAGGMVWWGAVSLAVREWFVEDEFGAASIVWASSHALFIGGLVIAFGPGSPRIRRIE